MAVTSAKIPREVIDELTTTVDIVEVVSNRTEIRQDGIEWVGLCPFHNENTPSFTVTPDKGLFYCFGCGATGNAIQFVEQFDGIEFPDAVRKLCEEKGIAIPNGSAGEPRPSRKKAAKKKKTTGARREATTKKRGKIVQTYDYIDGDGVLRYQVCRLEPKSFRQRQPDDNELSGWSWKVKGLVPLPYNLPELLRRPDATVIIAEGEKDVEALRSIDILATCNSGGATKWPEEIGKYFQGRNVVIIPDEDPQTLNANSKEPLWHEDGRPKHVGLDHADDVARKLTGIAASIRVVRLPGLPEKGDPADWIELGGTRAKLIQLAKQAKEWEEPMGPPKQTKADLEQPPEIDPPSDEPDPPAQSPGNDAPFQLLGYDEGHYYYLPHKTHQVTAISAGSHTSAAHLLTLAPLEFWEYRWPASRASVDWVAAANSLIRWQESVGTFDPAKVRGRGAWYDAGRSVLHLGNQLLVDNVAYKLHELPTNFIYEKKPALEALQIGDPLSQPQALGLYKVCAALNWQKNINAVMLAGWCVLAPICGAVPWRPHVWLTGQKGTGKSWIVDNIIAPVIGGSALVVQSNSTEAGIRQKLRQDARPVMFDEAEGENQHARARMQAVLELARQASHDGLAEIAKGTAAGKALTYRVRSMFMMGSINVGLSQASDKSRFTVLSLVRPRHGATGREQFEELSALVDNTLTREYCASLRARTYGLIPVIRKNAEILGKVAAEHLGNQRAGDQFGALLAGCYSLKSDDLISEKDARHWIESHDWGVEKDEEEDSDENRLMKEILHAQIKVDSARAGIRSRSVAELIDVALNGDEYDVTDKDSEQALARHGLRVKNKEWLMISESHPELRRILKETPWGQGWARILARIQGAETVKGYRFAGIVQRAVGVPIAAINTQSAPGPLFEEDAL